MKKILQQQGSMMMEYVILVFFVAVPVYLFWHGIPDGMAGSEIFPGIFDIDTGKLKPVGEYIQGFFQRLTCGIALPIP